MTVLRIYDPWECGEDGRPLDWEHCQACDGRGFAGEDDQRCGHCEWHGSLKVAARAALVIADMPVGPERYRHRVAEQHAVRCEDCGHPMSEGTWEGDPPQNAHKARVFCERRALEEIRNGNLAPGLPVVHFSPCDESCRHEGPLRWRYQADHQERPWTQVPADIEGRPLGLLADGNCIEATWRPVDVRTLGWKHDLRPERLAILCLRCWAQRSSSRPGMPIQAG